jgi:hypothetical protein
MANYVKATNFFTKDALLTGNPNKIIKGSEIDAEYNAIATAIASKADTTSPTFTGTPIAPTATAGNNSTQIATTAYVATAIGTPGTMAAQNANAVAITGGTVAGVTVAGTFTGNITGNVTGNATGSSGSCTGNAATATKLSTASGSAPSYSARAWVNFNGTGTVAIRASGNVSSITDNGTGDYTVNFTTAMPDANYAMVSSGGGDAADNRPDPIGTNTTTAPTANAIRLIQWYMTATTHQGPQDGTWNNIVILR